MIFIVALGLAFALTRPAIILIVDAVRSQPRWRFQTIEGFMSLVRMLNIVLLNFLMFLVPAFLIVRLRRPRPPLRALMCQPGFAACAAPVVLVLATLPLAVYHPSGRAGDVIDIVMQILLSAVAPLAWFFLVVTRRWNPEPSWIDRLGRVIGFVGMLCVPAHMLLIRLPY
jgi:hypothetical protein